MTGNTSKTIKAKVPSENNEAIKETTLSVKALKARDPLKDGEMRHNEKNMNKVLKVDPDFYKEFRFLEKSSKSTIKVPGQVY